MNELVRLLSEILTQQKDAVLVTVVSSSGSTPRGEGARMLISDKGRVYGTIGGGPVEFRSEEIAQTVLQEKKGRLEPFNLAPNTVADLGMVCGGKVTVLFQYLTWQNSELQELLPVISQCFKEQKQCWLVSSLEEENLDTLSFYSEASGWLGSPQGIFESEKLQTGVHFVEIDKKKRFTEELIHPGKVYIFGGGHVAQALVPVLKQLDFYCVVADDRGAFLTEELFPTADERVEIDLGKISHSFTITDKDYAVVMTRGHLYDFELSRQLLSSPARYIGVMGSRHKIAVQIEKLRKLGFSSEEISFIHMPIGLKIKAETPAELAISIAGELINERAAYK